MTPRKSNEIIKKINDPESNSYLNILRFMVHAYYSVRHHHKLNKEEPDKLMKIIMNTKPTRKFKFPNREDHDFLPYYQ